MDTLTFLPVKRRREDTTDKRNMTLQFRLPLQDGSCKVMFLRTLGLKTDGTITKFVRAKDNMNTSSSGTSYGYVNTDNRRKSPATIKKDCEVIQEHINSYHPQVSHYTRDHALKTTPILGYCCSN